VVSAASTGNAVSIDVNGAQTESEHSKYPDGLYSEPPATHRGLETSDYLGVEYEDLSLSDAIRTALHGCDLIRVKDGFSSPNNPIFSRPELIASYYDPAISSSEVLVGQRGAQAALSDFDTQFNTRILWGDNERIQNNRLLSGGVPPGETLNEGTATYQTELARNLVSGGRAGIVHDWSYNRSNRTSLLFPSAYEGALRAQIRQPLLAGAGKEYTSIAGNTSDVSLNITGTPQGILIAGVNQRVSMLELEQNVARLVRDVESQYWNLHLAHQSLAIVTSRRVELNETYAKVAARTSTGAPGGGAAGLAQMRDMVLQADIDHHNAVSAFQKAEILMRRMLGQRYSRSRSIRPIDRPFEADLVIDLDASLMVATASRAEIRRQVETVQGLQLQLRAAELLLKPRLDLIGEYRLNGFGDKLLGQGNPFSSSYGTLLSGDQTGWNAGFEFSNTIGNRLQLERLKNAKLKLIKAQSILHQQHLEVEHEIQFACNELERSIQEKRIQSDRVRYAYERLEALLAQIQVSDKTDELIALMQASKTVEQAEIALATSVTAYTESVSELRLKEGRLLSEHGVFFN
jgi:hypothetical protein